ncbi:hypothetical protein [Streptomyces violaceus]|uniref:Uncharacterized protein n=1 Tax=Streptomyces violaceus TaxID=1936 RepID=A0ABZ1P1U9_STRVL
MSSGRSAVYRDGCHVDHAATGTRSCVYGDRASSRTVVPFGDSHAAQWFPALQRLDDSHLSEASRGTCQSTT